MKKIVFILFLFVFSLNLLSQAKNNDANIIGHIVDSDGKHIPFASVYLKGTTIGTTTDETGHYQLINVPEGEHVLVARYTGYKTIEKEIMVVPNKTTEIKFNLEADVFGLQEVVVTGDRNEVNRAESSTIVSVVSPKLLETSQSTNLREGLSFAPGLRTENNCQNCGFSQLRMNGLEGPYSQILINSRPIFSGLAGVYGLELMPANMIEKVEVVRGGGSALYGSNAIGGTVNLIIKDPVNNSYEISATSSLAGIGMQNSGGAANDNVLQFNTSLISDNAKSALAIYGYKRDREPFDANGDSFSELTEINNITLGARFSQSLNKKNKIAVDFFSINESRRGGNKFDYKLHMADIAEAVDHRITSAAITYDRFINSKDKFSAFLSSQFVKRDSYYGAEQSLSDYGESHDFTYVAGAQYNINREKYKITLGLENRATYLQDTKLGYPVVDSTTSELNFTENTLLTNQVSITSGSYVQYEKTIKKFKFSAGIRYDHYEVIDKTNEGDGKSGDVLSPRLTMKYDILKNFQSRFSFSKGYRQPQIFDEDLHIESSGSRKIIHRNAADLKQESSNSYMISLDYNKEFKNHYFGILVEGFYTSLENAFINEIGSPDENGVIIYTRNNSEKTTSIKGVNIELNFAPSYDLSFKGGFTYQQSIYGDEQDFGERRFFRAPDDYGYFVMDWDFAKNFCFMSSATYTGKMLVPYFGPELQNSDDGELRTSERFFDLGMKLKYTFKLESAKLQFFAGVKNVFNSYQSDFDNGINRDPAYIYGPIDPRTIYIGLKLGNMVY